jgi:C-terminal processing protease CtpA/Prc
MRSAKLTFKFLIGIFLLAMFISCSDETEVIVPDDDATETEEPVETEENVYEEVNQWIYENMSLYYLWNDEIPEEPDDTVEPEEFFESLLYAYDATTNPEGDRFSFISDNADELLASFSGESTSTGMQFRLFYRSSDSNEILAQIIYVLEGSPADLAGLKRGDIFTRVNGTILDDENYTDLLYEYDNMTLTLAEVINNTLYEKDDTVTLTAVVLQENPIFLDTIYEMTGTKIGYLVYNQFIPGPNDSETDDYDDQLSSVFSEFKSSGVSELVIDLRYNPGGYSTSAVALASLIGTGVNSSSIFFREEYNDELQDYLENTYGSDYFDVLFDDKQENIGDQISNVYFLVSNYSASASELVINGLKPYMNVVLIGEQTYGKNVGSITITDDDSDDNNWALQPIIMKAYNSLGQSEYTAGFVPDVEIYEPLDLVPFGDTEDPLLSQAIGMITGSARMAKQPQNEMLHILELSVRHKPVTLKRTTARTAL